MKQVPEKLANLGKYSYSIYLVGFLVQQTVTFMHGGMMNPIVNTLESILISIILSIFIYRNVETKF